MNSITWEEAIKIAEKIRTRTNGRRRRLIKMARKLLSNKKISELVDIINQENPMPEHKYIEDTITRDDCHVVKLELLKNIEIDLDVYINRQEMQEIIYRLNDADYEYIYIRCDYTVIFVELYKYRELNNMEQESVSAWAAYWEIEKRKSDARQKLVEHNNALSAKENKEHMLRYEINNNKSLARKILKEIDEGK